MLRCGVMFPQLSLHQRMRCAQEDIRGAVLPEFTTEGAGYDDRLEREFLNTAGNIPLAAFAADDKDFAIGHLAEHGFSLGEYKAN